MSSTNPGTGYETLVQEIYQALLNETEPRTIKVEHDVKLEGRSGCKHQVDVYWEFESGRETYKTLIECKHYAKDLGVGIVRDFFGVVHDIGDVKGIIVTTHGYQSGARKFADHYKIHLKEVRAPEDRDWEGRVRSIEARGTGYYPDNIKVCPELDENWLSQKGISGEQLQSSYFGSGETELVDASGEATATFEEIIKEHPMPSEPQQDHDIYHPLNDAYIQHPELGPLKVHGLRIVCDVVETVAEFTSSGDEIVKGHRLTNSSTYGCHATGGEYPSVASF